MGTLKHERSLQTQWLLLCTCISFVRVEFHWSYYRSQQYKCGARKKVRVTEACWALTVRSKQLYFFERLAWSKTSCYPMGKQSAPPGCCCMVRSKPRVSSLCIMWQIWNSTLNFHSLVVSLISFQLWDSSLAYLCQRYPVSWSSFWDLLPLGSTGLAAGPWDAVGNIRAILTQRARAAVKGSLLSALPSRDVLWALTEAPISWGTDLDNYCASLWSITDDLFKQTNQ